MGSFPKKLGEWREYSPIRSSRGMAGNGGNGGLPLKWRHLPLKTKTGAIHQQKGASLRDYEAAHFTRGNPRVEQLSDCHRAASWRAGELNKKRARRQCCLPWCGGRRGLRELAFTKYNKAQIARMPDAQPDAQPNAQPSAANSLALVAQPDAQPAAAAGHREVDDLT